VDSRFKVSITSFLAPLGQRYPSNQSIKQSICQCPITLLRLNATMGSRFKAKGHTNILFRILNPPGQPVQPTISLNTLGSMGSLGSLDCRGFLDHIGLHASMGFLGPLSSLGCMGALVSLSALVL
jgi:hypothetical protein